MVEYGILELLDELMSRGFAPFVAFMEVFVSAVWKTSGTCENSIHPSSPSPSPSPSGDRILDGFCAVFPKSVMVAKRFTALVRRLLYNQGKFKEKERVSPLLIAVVALHLGICAFVAMYPYWFPARTYDGWFLSFVLMICLHWTLFKGECIVSYWEKLCVYESYKMGDAPLHHWFIDVFPFSFTIVMILLLALMFHISICTVIIRNTLLSPTAINLCKVFILYNHDAIAFA